jgi:hypothetical protein
MAFFMPRVPPALVVSMADVGLATPRGAAHVWRRDGRRIRTMIASKWVSMATAPRDGSLVLVRLHASEQGPSEVDAVRWSRSARSGEEAWVANDSDPFARVAYAEAELAGWMPLPTQMPKLRSDRAAVGDPAPRDGEDDTDGGGI